MRTILGIALILFGPVVNLSSKFVAQNHYLLDPRKHLYPYRCIKSLFLHSVMVLI